MNKKIKRIGQVLAFVLVLVLSIDITYQALRWKDTSGDYISSVDQLYNTKNNLVDVVFVGSSHCYCGIYPSLFWQDAGIAAFDMAISGMDKNTAYYALKELLKTQKPKLVFVDCYGLLFDKHEVEANEYRNYLSMKYSPDTIKQINSYVEEEKKQDYLARFPIVHTRYKELQKKDFKTYAPNKFGRGGLYSWHSEEAVINEDAIASEEIGELSESNKKWIDDMYELAEKNDFSLELMLIPTYLAYDTKARLNACEIYIEEKGIPFTDFNLLRGELEIDKNTDFIDSDHLNAYGAGKLTKYLIDRIKRDYSLTDHRGDLKYYQWDMDLSWMNQLRSKDILQNASSEIQYVETILNTENQITIVSLEGDLSQETGYYQVFEEMGMNYEDYLLGGKWIIRDGYMEKIVENQVGSNAYSLNLGNNNFLRVAYNGLCNPKNIMINKEAYQTGYNLTFVTYSTLTEEVIANRGF